MKKRLLYLLLSSLTALSLTAFAAEHAKKEEPAKKAEPAKHDEHAKKAEPAKKTEPAKHDEHAKQAAPAKHDEHAKQAAPVKKAEPVKHEAQAHKPAPVKRVVHARAEHAEEHVDKKLGPRDVLWRLRQGNQAYVAGRASATVSSARRSSLVAGQHPHAVILTCADSRVPPEYIFHEGLGNLFVVRVAGVVADPVVTGSIEYAAEHLHSPLIVVMGHTRCGAVKAAIETPAPKEPAGPGANIESILAMLRPGLHKASPQSDPWRTAVYGGVEQSVSDLRRQSKILPEMERDGHVGIVGAVYEIETGRVVFSEMLRPELKVAEEPGRLLRWERASAPAPVRTQPAVHSTRAAAH